MKEDNQIPNKEKLIELIKTKCIGQKQPFLFKGGCKENLPEMKVLLDLINGNAIEKTEMDNEVYYSWDIDSCMEFIGLRTNFLNENRNNPKQVEKTPFLGVNLEYLFEITGLHNLFKITEEKKGERAVFYLNLKKNWEACLPIENQKTLMTYESQIGFLNNLLNENGINNYLKIIAQTTCLIDGHDKNNYHTDNLLIISEAHGIRAVACLKLALKLQNQNYFSESMYFGKLMICELFEETKWILMYMEIDKHYEGVSFEENTELNKKEQIKFESSIKKKFSLHHATFEELFKLFKAKHPNITIHISPKDILVNYIEKNAKALKEKFFYFLALKSFFNGDVSIASRCDFLEARYRKVQMAVFLKKIGKYKEAILQYKSLLSQPHLEETDVDKNDYREALIPLYLKTRQINLAEATYKKLNPNFLSAIKLDILKSRVILAKSFEAGDKIKQYNECKKVTELYNSWLKKLKDEQEISYHKKIDFHYYTSLLCFEQGKILLLSEPSSYREAYDFFFDAYKLNSKITEKKFFCIRAFYVFEKMLKTDPTYEEGIIEESIEDDFINEVQTISIRVAATFDANKNKISFGNFRKIISILGGDEIFQKFYTTIVIMFLRQEPFLLEETLQFISLVREEKLPILWGVYADLIDKFSTLQLDKKHPEKKEVFIALCLEILKDYLDSDFYRLTLFVFLVNVQEWEKAIQIFLEKESLLVNNLLDTKINDIKEKGVAFLELATRIKKKNVQFYFYQKAIENGLKNNPKKHQNPLSNACLTAVALAIELSCNLNEKAEKRILELARVNPKLGNDLINKIMDLEKICNLGKQQLIIASFIDKLFKELENNKDEITLNSLLDICLNKLKVSLDEEWFIRGFKKLSQLEKLKKTNVLKQNILWELLLSQKTFAIKIITTLKMDRQEVLKEGNKHFFFEKLSEAEKWALINYIPISQYEILIASLFDLYRHQNLPEEKIIALMEPRECSIATFTQWFYLLREVENQKTGRVLSYIDKLKNSGEVGQKIVEVIKSVDDFSAQYSMSILWTSIYLEPDVSQKEAMYLEFYRKALIQMNQSLKDQTGPNQVKLLSFYQKILPNLLNIKGHFEVVKEHCIPLIKQILESEKSNTKLDDVKISLSRKKKSQQKKPQNQLNLIQLSMEFLFSQKEWVKDVLTSLKVSDSSLNKVLEEANKRSFFEKLSEAEKWELINYIPISQYETLITSLFDCHFDQKFLDEKIIALMEPRECSIATFTQWFYLLREVENQKTERVLSYMDKIKKSGEVGQKIVEVIKSVNDFSAQYSMSILWASICLEPDVSKKETMHLEFYGRALIQMNQSLKDQIGLNPVKLLSFYQQILPDLLDIKGGCTLAKEHCIPLLKEILKSQKNEKYQKIARDVFYQILSEFIEIHPSIKARLFELNEKFPKRTGVVGGTVLGNICRLLDEEVCSNLMDVDVAVITLDIKETQLLENMGYTNAPVQLRKQPNQPTKSLFKEKNYDEYSVDIVFAQPCADFEKLSYSHDFTIANIFMAFNEKGKIEFFDFHNGLIDIVQKTLRTPYGETLFEFICDPFRLLRAIKYCVFYGYTLVDGLVPIIEKFSKNINKIVFTQEDETHLCQIVIKTLVDSRFPNKEEKEEYVNYLRESEILGCLSKNLSGNLLKAIKKAFDHSKLFDKEKAVDFIINSGILKCLKFFHINELDGIFQNHKVDRKEKLRLIAEQNVDLNFINKGKKVNTNEEFSNQSNNQYYLFSPNVDLVDQKDKKSNYFKF